MKPCPSASELEAFAAEPTGLTAIGKHVAGCAGCRALIEEIRENQKFMARVGGVLAAANDAAPGSKARFPHPLPPAGTVPGYELTAEISRGGQGVVYRAVQLATKRPAAVKMLLSGAFASGQQRRRFEREIEIAARLRHPCIVSVFDSGETADGRRYVAMEYVPGEALDTSVRRRWPLPRGGQRARVDHIMRLMRDVADGVGFAHANGVIHRDLKPSNILVDADGKPRVVDFGLARTAEEPPHASMTVEFAGTLAYAAPEQFATDLGLVGTRTDVYALGLILYNAITETHPYPCDGPLAEVSAHTISTEPTPLSTYAPKIPSDAETIVLKALAKDPARRYSSASALAADIDNYLTGRPIAARPDSTLYVLRRLAAKHRVPTAAAVVVVLTIIAAAVGLTLLAHDLDHQRVQTAEAQTQNTIRRARLLAAGGEQHQSERTLWQEAMAAGIDPGAPELGFEESLAIRQPVWALMEYYSAVPRRARANLGHRDVFHVRLDAERKMVHASAKDGASASWTTDGQLVSSTPAWGGAPSSQVVRQAPISGAWHAIVEGGSLRVADASTRETLSGPVEVKSPLRYLDVSQRGTYVALVDAQGRLRVFDGPKLRERSMLWKQDADYEAVGFSENEQWITATSRATPSDPPRLHVWSTTDQRITLTPRTVRDTRLVDGGHLTTPAVSNKGDWAVASGRTYLFTWWTAGDTEPVYKLGSDAEISTIRSWETQPNIVAGTASGFVRFGSFYDLPPTTLRQSTADVTCIDRSDELGLVAVGDRDGSVSLFDVADRGWIRTPWAHTWSGCATLTVSADGRWFAWAPNSGGFTIGETERGQPIRELSEHERRFLSLEFTLDAGQLVTGSNDGRVCLWGVEQDRLQRTIAEGLAPVWSLRMSPDGQWLAAGTGDGTLWLWKVSDWAAPPRTITSDRGSIARVAFSPDSTLIATAAIEGAQGRPGEVVVRSTTTGQELWRAAAAPLQSVRAVAFSPDGKYLAVGSDEPSVRVRDASSGAIVNEISGVPWDIFDLAYDPTGRLLFCAGRGPALLVFDPGSGIELAALRVHWQSVRNIAVRSNGLRLFTGGDDSWIGLWDLDKLRRNVRGNAPYWKQELAKKTVLSRGYANK